MAVGEGVLAAIAVAVGAVASHDPGRISPTTAAAVGIVAAVVGGLRLLISPPLSIRAVDLWGKHAIVTGGSSGVGKETARTLAKWGCTVILAVRDLEKGERARADITRSLPRSCRGKILVWRLDLADISSVRRFASRYKDSGMPLHILVNNGGVRQSSLQLTTDGIEAHYQVNHLSHMLLTMLLVPILRTSAPSRIVHVSSSAHAYGVIDPAAYAAEVLNRDASVFDHIMRSRVEGVYGDTKLMQVVFSEQLQARLKTMAPGVDSFAVHPGFVDTGFGKNDRRWLQTMLVATRPFLARSASQAAVSVIYAGTAKELHGKGGAYISDGAVVKQCNVKSVTKEEAKWLWEESHRILGISNFMGPNSTMFGQTRDRK